MVEKARRRPVRGLSSASLNREQAVYEANLSEWLSGHEGEYVLIKGDQVDGFYESRDAALTAGYARFGIGALFVKQVSPTETVHHVPNALIWCRSFVYRSYRMGRETDGLDQRL